MTEVTSIEITDDRITFYVPSNELPDTEYVNQQLRQVLDTEYEGNFIDFILYVRKNQVLPISFTHEDYCELAEHIQEYFTYNLHQARTIIRWIDQTVAADLPDSSWGPIYYEILEGAHE